MRFKEFLREYNQAKTAQVFGNKLVTALATDKSSHFPSPLGTDREYLRQKDKIGSEPEESNKQVIIKDILTAIEQADPTPNKEYAQWLAKCYANEFQKIEDIISKGADWLKKYHQFKVKRILPDNLRNIANLKFSQLYDIIANDELNAKLDAIENAPSKDKGSAETIYDDASVRIIHPMDEAAACYYGQGTQWCTAGRSNNMFNRYNKDGKMYILLPKNPQYDGEKYQLHFSSEQFMDETDADVGDLLALLQDRFNPDVLAFFKQVEPVIGTWVAYASDEVLQPIIDQIAQLATGAVNEILSEWESEDSSYLEYLDDNGYYDDETGDINWERVAEDNIDYLRYNDEARKWYNGIEDALRPTPGQCRDMATERDHEYGNKLAITDLEKCVSSSISDNMKDSNFSAQVRNDVENNIFVRKDDKGYYVQIKDYNGKVPAAREGNV
jgi:hypothetical protein